MKKTKDLAATLPQATLTPKGARIDLAVYVYPDGRGTKGNFTTPNGPQNVSFDSESEAILAFAAMLRETRGRL